MDVTSLDSASTPPGSLPSDGDTAPVQHHDAAPKAQGHAETGSTPGPSFADASTGIFVGGSPSSSPASGVIVTLQVRHDPDEVVAVYRDPATGRILSQVPTGVLVQLSQFFDQQAGGLVDWNA